MNTRHIAALALPCAMACSASTAEEPDVPIQGTWPDAVHFVAYDDAEACWYSAPVVAKQSLWQDWLDQCLDYDGGGVPRLYAAASLPDGTCVVTQHRLDADCWPEDPDILPCSASTLASCCDQETLPYIDCDPPLREAL